MVNSGHLITIIIVSSWEKGDLRLVNMRGETSGLLLSGRADDNHLRRGE